MRRIILLISLAVAALAATADTNEMLVSTAWLQQHLQDRDLTIIDVADSDAFAAAHIRGARQLAVTDVVVTRNNIPNELPDPAALQATLRRIGVPNRGRIVLYSRDTVSAARVFFTLDYAGRGDDVALLDGGLSKWTSEHRPVVTGAPREVAESNFVVRAHPETLVRLNAMRMIVGCTGGHGDEVAIVDARAPSEYIGAVPGSGIVNAGHIDYAINIPWNENLTGGETPVFRSAADLRELYRTAGIKDDATIVLYCRTGTQACVNYFVLRYLGRDVHLYDGSYIEWNANSMTVASLRP